MTQRHYYKDFASGKRRFTRGAFVGWSEPTGPLNAVYAGFQLQTQVLWIPKYLLENKSPAEARRGLHQVPA